jgi:LmbE family N-acetylglucosaminyl deacetylase
MAAVPGGKILVLSPHLDDGVLSLGGFIATAVVAGADVRIVTIFGGDPDSTASAGNWDSQSGFSTAGEATRSRREEDRRACERLGAATEWLPFLDKEYGAPPDGDEVWDRLAAHVQRADLVFTPGRPLIHPDHDWVASLVSQRMVDWSKVVFYAELPYHVFPERGLPGERKTTDHALSREWTAPRLSYRARESKWRSTAAYASQLPWLAPLRYRWVVLRARLGCERLAWPGS